MKNYELMIIIKPDIGIDEIEKQLDTIKEHITSNKGDVTFEDQWGVRDIAYKIKKYDRGYYTVMNFSAKPDFMKELDKTLGLSNDVLRHLIVNIPEGYEAKSYKELEKEEESEESEKEEAPKAKKTTRKTTKAAAEKSEEKPAKAEKDKKEESSKKDSGASLEDVDAKLKSIIDNPDLNF